MVALVSQGMNRMRILQKISYTPRWIIFILDVCLSLFSIGVACLVLANFQIDKIVLEPLIKIMFYCCRGSDGRIYFRENLFRNYSLYGD